MRKPSKATSGPQQRPSEGGSYVRRPDGGLERRGDPEPMTPAEPAPTTGGDE